jgi:nicotinamidase-related amidase
MARFHHIGAFVPLLVADEARQARAMDTTSPRRALVVVDVQREYVAGPLTIHHPPHEEGIARVVEAVGAAEALGLPVAVVQHTAPEGFPVFDPTSELWQLHPDVAAATEHATVRIEKSYGSVFAGTGLAGTLRDLGVDTVTFVGYMTNNCILASVVESEGLGFTAEVLRDATGAINLANEAGTVSARDLHETLMVLFHSNLAAVATVAGWTEAAKAGQPLAPSNLVVSAIAGAEAVSSPPR